MGNRPGVAKRADPGHQRLLRRLPRLPPQRQLGVAGAAARKDDGKAFGDGGNLGVQRRQRRVRYGRLVLQHQHRLDQAGDPSARLQVANVCLYRAHHQRPCLLAAWPKHGGQRTHLNGIAQPRPSAVRLEVVELFRLQTRRGQRVSQQRLLGQPVGGRQARALAVRAHANAWDDGVHGCSGLGGALQHDDAAALAAQVAVGAGVKGVAAARRRGHPGAGKRGAHLGRDNGVHAGHKGEIAAIVGKGGEGSI